MKFDNYSFCVLNNFLCDGEYDNKNSKLMERRVREPSMNKRQRR